MRFEDCKTLADFEKFYPPRDLPAGTEVTRIGPSPTGMPHIGTAMQAILNRAIADKSEKGTFILRIEDTDRARTIENAQEEIIAGLEWLNTHVNEGPGDLGGAYGPYVQSERVNLYRTAAEHLIESGHAYPCFCSEERLNMVRKTQTAQHQSPRYDRHCRHLSKEDVEKRITAGETYVVRMKVPDNETLKFKDEVRGDISFESSVLDDSVILKTDGFPTYHLASVVDDHFMRITTVIRGEEWISSTPKHLLLYRYFGWEHPRFLHTVLLRDSQKRKLSKRSGDTSLAWFRRQGFLPSGFRNFLTRILWAHPHEKDIYPFEEFVELLDTTALPSTGPVADMDLLQFINNKYISNVTHAERAKMFIQYLEYLLETGQNASSTIAPRQEAEETTTEELKKIYAEVTRDKDYTVKVMSIEPGRYQRLADIIFNSMYFYDALYVPATPDQFGKKAPLDVCLKVLETFSSQLKDSMTAADIEGLIKSLVKDLGLKNPQVFMTLRLALTGRDRSPPLPEIIEALGTQHTQERLSASMEVLKSGTAESKQHSA